MIYPITTKGPTVIDSDNTELAVAESVATADRIARCLNACGSYISPAMLRSDCDSLRVANGELRDQTAEFEAENKKLSSDRDKLNAANKKLHGQVTELEALAANRQRAIDRLNSEIRDLKAAATESDSEAHKRRIAMTVATTLRESTERAFADAIRLVYTFNDALENLADAVAADLSVEDSEDVQRALTEARAILGGCHE